MERILNSIVKLTEKRLTEKKALKAMAKKNRTFKSELLDWLDALLFAVIVVLLINQYLFQLFVIPTPSMVGTLLVGDRVLVSKTNYGIEIFPAGPKIFNKRTPERDEIITFYNPDYESKGPVFDVLSQIIYLGTMSLVNIDVDENGNPRERLFVKRTVGVPGDTIRFIYGNVEIRPSGLDNYISESKFREQNGLAIGPNRTIDSNLYPYVEANLMVQGMKSKGLTDIQIPLYLRQRAVELENKNTSGFYDQYSMETAKLEGEYLSDPSDFSTRSSLREKTIGIYIPDNSVLPLGDNRDNSSDGRYFGPISTKKVNGHVVSRVWPFNRVSSLSNK